jgi:predicted RNase H-like HicB family nuclease
VKVTVGGGRSILKTMTRNFPVLLHPGEDGFILVECPALPGCLTQGRTREEALANIREAIELALGGGEAVLPQTIEGWELDAVPVAVPA